MSSSPHRSWPRLRPVPLRGTVLGGLPGRPVAGPFAFSRPAAGPTLLTSLGIPEKRKVFISYHHHGDQAYKDAVVRLYQDQYELVEDNSLDRFIDTDDLKYVEGEIREDYIRGASVTIVLCGARTHERKFVDWEMYAMLLKKAGLIGIRLPTLQPTPGQTTGPVPDRLHDNIMRGYALWRHGNDMVANSGVLRVWLEDALAKDKRLIDNSRPKRQRNG